MNRDGIGLLEAIVALAILGLAGITAIAGAAAQMDAGRRARLHVEAAMLADYRMERLRLLSASALAELYREHEHGRFDAPLSAFTWEASAAPHLSGAERIELKVVVRSADVRADLTTRVFRPVADQR